jgi:hypothetical protein
MFWRASACAAALLILSCSGTPPVPGPSCSTGLVDCDGKCSDPKLDDLNCGGCGAACANGTACANAVCVPTMCGTSACNPGQVCVQQACTDKACVGVVCAPGESCAAGACVCNPGLSTCGGACVDTQTDNANCGLCGHACAMGTTCALGSCFSSQCGSTTCDPGFVCAAGTCVEAACAGKTCDAGKKCIAGTCTCLGSACQCIDDTQCGGTTPKCDLSAAKCVGCLSTMDCNAGEICRTGVCTMGCSQQSPTCPAGKQCDLSSGSCVDCQANGDCGTGTVCSPAKQCVPGCAADHPSCAPGTSCDTNSNTCVQCATSSDCAPGKICDTTGTCVDGCSSTKPCLSGKTCDTAAGKCVDCLNDSNCTQSGFPACDVTANVCVACTQNRNCQSPLAPACDTSTHQCVVCAANGDCPAGYLCTNFACVAGCSAARPLCPSGQTCDVSVGKCVECTTNLDCNASRPVCDTANRRCVQCLPGSTPTTCPAGTFCDVTTCTSGCAGDADCSQGKRCQTSSHFCVDCLSNADCTTDAGVARTCTSWGTCSVTCTSATNCNTGELCCGSSCTRPLTDTANCGGCGQACLPGQQCLNGVCQRYLTGLSMAVRQNDQNGAVLFTQIDPNVDHCVDLTFPDCQWTPLNWTNSYVVWTGFINLPLDGIWGLATTSKNGSRVWMDGVNVLNNNWNTSQVNPRLVRDNRQYTAGLHALTVEFQTVGAPGSGVSLQWAPPGGSLQVVPQSALVYQGPCVFGETSCGNSCSNMLYDDLNCGACGNACPGGNRCIAGACRPTISGLATQYFDRPDYWNGVSLLQHLEPKIDTCDNFELLACSWSPMDFSHYGVVFNGYLFAPEAGSYALGAAGADGWRITLDGRTYQTINYIGNAQAAALRAANTTLLNTGLHTFTVEMWANGGGSPHGISVFWKRPSGVEEAIPSAYFSTSGPCPPGQNLCGTACVDLQSSNVSCGLCNNACTNNTQCLNGSCTPVLSGVAARYYDRADYWNGLDLFDRVEPNIDKCNDWSAYDCSFSPISQGYGAVWDGYLVVPQDGTYRFAVTGADGWRLAINNFTVQSVNYLGGAVSVASRVTNNVTLAKGLRRVHLEYWAAAPGAPRGISLAWGPPGQALTAIPQSNLITVGPCGPGETSCNGTCGRLSSSNLNCGQCGIACASGSRCVAGQCTPVIPGLAAKYFDRADYWNGIILSQGTDSQIADCNNASALDCSWAPFTQGFGATWQGMIDAPADGTYGLHVTGADGWRFAVDGRNINQFNYIGGAQAVALTQSSSVMLNSGLHTVFLEYWSAAGGAPRGVDLAWSPPGTTTRVSVPSTNLVQRGPCAPGLVVCGNACVSLANDDLNCGSCSLACGSGTKCVAAQCLPVKPGLSTTYWDRPDYWNGTLLFSEAEPNIHTCTDFTQLNCAWAPLTWTGFGTVWRGYLDVTVQGTYDLGFVAKDSADLNLDGRDILRYNIGGPAQAGPALKTVRMTLNAGMHPLVVGYESIAGAVQGNGVELVWRPPGQAALGDVPAANLFYTGPCVEGTDFCAGSCVSKAFDGNNCGGCGNSCGGSAGCISGTCRPLTAGIKVSWWNAVNGGGTPAATTMSAQLNACASSGGACTGATPSGQTAPYRSIYTGVILAPAPGSYHFSLSSRSGSTLVVDGHTIINNNYNWSQDAFVKKGGTTFLAAGWHDLTVDTYGFQTTGVGVDLSWTPPGAAAEVLVPAANLSHY